MTTRSMHRRDFISSAAAGAAALVCGTRTASAEELSIVRVGYLHVLSVDAHLWLATHLGSFERENLRIEPREFTTGIELFQALVGGSLDVLTTGGVLSNFPARGQGKVFLINDLELATGQIWAHPSKGIHTIKDLKGRQVATTRGTTAHDLLHQALKSVGLDSTKDVEIVNQRMSDAVTAFIAGAVPAVSLWVPFNGPVKAKSPEAKMLVDASAYPSATIVDGWAARNDFYRDRKDVLKRFIRAWAPANDMINNNPNEALRILQTKYYPKISTAEVEEMYRVTRWYPTKEWMQYYRDGSVAKWLNQVTSFNVEIGAIQNPIMAEEYFDPTLFLDAANTAAN
ncbi:MAG TPA: ABC transporter substrate-binding protein [Xanthobacteraceae bacterium]